jgi:hypothetical protein
MDIGCKGWGYMAIGVRVSNLRMVKYTGSRRIGETNGRGRSYAARYSTERCVIMCFKTNASKEQIFNRKLF